jgi:hypothetical protein
LPNSADAAERFEWLVIFVFVGVFCAALAVRSFYPRRKENLDLFLFIFDGMGKTWAFIGENEGKIFERRTTGEVKNRIFERGRAGKTRLAKGYLGLQGTWHEREGMGKGEGALSGREELEGDFRRNGDSSINFAIQGITG